MVLNPNLSPEEELEKQLKFIAAIGKKKIKKTGCPLTDVENLVIRGMVEGKTYADQEMVSEYKKLLKNAGKKDENQDSSE